MNTFASYVRGTLHSAWHGGFGEQALRAAIVAPILALCGFVSAWLFPSVSENILHTLTQAISSAGVAEASGINAAALLFSNNMTAAFSALLWGLVPFVYLAAFPLGYNFYILGVMGAYYVQTGVGLGTYLVGILPHGIFELPALVLFCAAGLHLCERITARLRGNREIRPIQAIAEVSVLYLYVILPLLAVAALIESFLTPALLSALLS